MNSLKMSLQSVLSLFRIERLRLWYLDKPGVEGGEAEVRPTSTDPEIHETVPTVEKKTTR